MHELLHCHLNSLVDNTSAMWGAATSKATAMVADASFNQQVELVVDTIADVLSPLLPDYPLPAS